MISVVIPTYNEKKNIFKIAKKLSKIKIISEVIFVDDNSTDGTFKEILKLRSKKFVGFLRRNKKRDLSKSVLYGVSKSKYKVILVMDCDLQHDVKYIKNMWRKFKKFNCNLVIASRFKNTNFSGNLGFIRSIISKFAINTINLIFGKKSSDPLSGFFMCEKKIITRYKNDFFLTGYKILFDILYNGKENIKIIEEEIVFKRRNSENSKFNMKIIWLFIKQLFYTKFVVK